jgi:hypothetical protein
VGSVSSLLSPVVAHPAQIRDTSSSVSAVFFIMLIVLVFNDLDAPEA